MHRNEPGSTEDRRSIQLRTVVLAAAAVFLALLFVRPALASAAQVTVQAYNLNTGTDIPDFQYLINVDNARDPDAANPLNRPSLGGYESNSEIVAQGDQGDQTSPDLPEGRYLVSIRSDGYKMWGQHISVPEDTGGTVRIGLRPTPLPLGHIRVFVFNDSNWTNAAPDPEENGLGGFHVTLEDQLHEQVSVDYFNDPLCGGDCVTEPDGFIDIPNLAPGTYFIKVTPPDGSGWVQTTTIDGSFAVQAGVEEGSDGTGAPGESLFEPPNRRTGYWFGFAQEHDFANPGSGSITGQARNWVGWPPFDNLVMGDPVADPYVALTNTANDSTVFMGRADGDGNFTIPNVPPGAYMLSIWDEQLSYIIRFLNVEVGASAATRDVELGDVGVSRWFGWLSGDVYVDLNGDSIRDINPATGELEPGISNTGVDQRWRDGSIKEETFTDPTGHYEYPTAEGGPLGKFFIGEVGFTRFATTGASLHDELDPSIVNPVPSDLGGGLLTNQKVVEGHRSDVDWGKQVYPQGTPGQIVGIVMHATTRNELDARFAAAENYEPGIPNVHVFLEGLGPDNQPNTADDPILNDYYTDKWQPPTDCDVTDSSGNPLPDLNPLIGPNCLEVPQTSGETKDGAFDGGYAFADMCPLTDLGESTFPCADEDKVPLVAGDYITHVIMPRDANDNPIYQIEREDDVNVDNGPTFVPAIPPPPCVGDLHLVSGAPDRSPYNGQERPLCDKRLVQLQNQQNANSDFFLFAKNGVETPGRIVGLVSDDIYFTQDKQSIWYGEPRPIANVPIGIRDYAGRLITTVKTDEEGGYEALLPSTETYNCPTPQGICPGMYVVVVNDPGDKANPNQNFNPNYLTASFAWDVWPGQTDQLDTPLDPISGTGCELPLNMPELLQVSRAVVPQGGNRQVTIQGDWFGNQPGTVTLTGTGGGAGNRTLTSGNGIVSWSDRQIVISVPNTTGAGLITPGPKQLAIRRPGAGGLSTSNGLTLHVLGPSYSPPVAQAAPPVNPDGTANPHALQNAIDGAPAGAIVTLQPGTYRENVIMHKRVVLQGLGPGGIVGSPEVGGRDPDDPRFDIQGSVIDGRFWRDNEADWTSKLGTLSWDGNPNVPVGAGITVVASSGEFDVGGTNGRARIDGIGITTGQAHQIDGGAGGLEVNAYGRNLQVTNDIFESNQGQIAGAIGLGTPNTGDNQNDNVVISHDRVMGNGGLVRAGGIGVFNGADGYSIDNNIICSNFASEYGAGISHWGRSPNGTINANQIYYNEAVDSGAGISIQQQEPNPAPGPGDPPGAGSGTVDVTRNLLESNMSGDDGGGLFVQSAFRARINVVNNMIVDNGAAHLGGAINLGDSSNVAIINDTIANNVSTSSAEGSDGLPHSAGLSAEPNSTNFQATLPPGAANFSNPVALFNDIFWQNQAFVLDRTDNPPALVPQGFMDFEITGAPNPSTFTPRYSLLTSAYGPANQGNIVGQNPNFVTPFVNELAVGPSRLDPTFGSVTIVGQDPPVGLAGDYHVQNGGLVYLLTSPVIDRGVGFSNVPFPPPLFFIPNANSIAAPNVDYDGQGRPVLRTIRVRTRFDLGADEVLP